MQKILSKVFPVVILSVFCFNLSTATAAAQTVWTGACVGAGDAADVATLQGVQCLIANILNVVMTIFSFVGFGMFIYGALIWLFAGGQTSNVEKARNTFTYAIFGLLLALSSFIIIQLISHFTGLEGLLSIRFLGNDPPTSVNQNTTDGDGNAGGNGN